MDDPNSLVPVNVIVTDERDRPVTDLKQEEFQILEDNVAQQIRYFSLDARTGAAAATVDRAQLVRAVPVYELRPQARRIFLILLGQGRHQDRYHAIDELIRFVKADLLPKDLIAVFAYNRATDFTDDHEKIAAVLERYKRKSDKIESWLEAGVLRLKVVYGEKKIPDSYQSEIDGIFEAREQAAHTSAETHEWDRIAASIVHPSLWSAENMFDGLKSTADGFSLPFSEFVHRAATPIQDMQNLLVCTEYLRYLEGEKQLLFFTGRGLLAPNGHIESDRGIAAIANDARVSINCFHTWSLALLSYVGQEKGPQPDPMFVSDPRPAAIVNSIWSDKQIEIMSAGITNLSRLTGGRLSVNGNLGAVLDSVDHLSRGEYLLGYHPVNSKFDGRFRNISVRVNRPGLAVSFRRGYFARQLVPFDRAETLAYSRITAAGGYLSADGTDVKFKIRRDVRNTVRIDVTIDAHTVAFRNEKGQYLGDLRIALFFMDADGKYMGESWDRLELRLPPEIYRRYLKSGVPYSTPIPLSPGQNLKIVVYDTLGDNVGSKQVQI